MENDQEKLLEEIIAVEVLVKENPCGMKLGVLNSLRNVMHDFIGKHCMQGATKEQVALYYGRDVRTISRWKNEYPDFPNGKTKGANQSSYNWMDVIGWKLKHRDLFIG